MVYIKCHYNVKDIHTYVTFVLNMMLLYWPDVINGIKMDESCDTTDAVDVETSLNSLRLNDLSTPLNVLSPGAVKSVLPNVFKSLPPGKFGPRGIYTCALSQ